MSRPHLTAPDFPIRPSRRGHRLAAAGRLLLTALLVVPLGLAPGAAFALPVTGTLLVTGDVVLSQTVVDFRSPTGPPDGELRIGVGSTGTFAPLVGTAATILDLNLATPVGTPIAVTNFLTFPVNP